MAMESFVVGDSFRSNSGEGPWTATLVHVERGVAVLARRRRGMKEVHFSQLPISFLSSPACGWRPAQVSPVRVPRGVRVRVAGPPHDDSQRNWQI